MSSLKRFALLVICVFPIFLAGCGTETSNTQRQSIDEGGNGTSNGNTNAQFTASPVSGVASLTVDFSVVDPQAGYQYNWDFGDGSTTGNGSSTSHTYSTVGNYTAILTATDTQSNESNSDIRINVFADMNNSSAIVPNTVLFFDDFDYVINRDDPNAAAEFTTQGEWSGVRTQQSNGGGGYFYTTNTIPGYSGSMPGANSNRVLAIEMLPGSTGGQTDAYLQYGTPLANTDLIPGNVWIQFWIYINNFGDQQSQFANRNKFIYPCADFYPCNTNKWVIQIGPTSENPFHVQESTDRPFLYQRSNMVGLPNYSIGEYPGAKLGPFETSQPLVPNRWTLVKIHYDTTHANDANGNAGPNAFEMWIKPIGQNWIKTTEWISGVTPNFTWHLTAAEAGGHKVFRMPTTFPGGGNDPAIYNSWMYLDDFAFGASEEDLPVYPY